MEDNLKTLFVAVQDVNKFERIMRDFIRKINDTIMAYVMVMVLGENIESTQYNTRIKIKMEENCEKCFFA